MRNAIIAAMLVIAGCSSRPPCPSLDTPVPGRILCLASLPPVSTEPLETRAQMLKFPSLAQAKTYVLMHRKTQCFWRAGDELREIDF
jgi:hypothetical protein